MSKAYPSNLTRGQYEFLSETIPEPKRGGRKREVDMWEVLNAIFYVHLHNFLLRSCFKSIFGNIKASQT